MKYPYIFGIRHLSPAGALHLCRFLDEKKPRLVLVEGPDDFDDMMADMVRSESKPPIAVLAYTVDTPVRTILYPLAEYSPEYQAIKWCHDNKTECHFIDLPSEIFLAMPEKEDYDGDRTESIYEKLERQAGEDGHDMFWERTVEHTLNTQAYHRGSNLFGESLRQHSVKTEWQNVLSLVREAYMRRKINEALREGYKPDEIVIVTGSYHVAGLKEIDEGMTDDEYKLLPRTVAKHTLMPYSYYRLSTRSGYGAGNQAPGYYELLWHGLRESNLQYATQHYLAEIAKFQREHGFLVSSAEVIEAVRLANALARLRGGLVPALRDIRDAAVTCLGGGEIGTISLAVADAEIGTKIGSLPDGVSRTCIQDDFYGKLGELKLEKYRSLTAMELSLDLRENRNAATVRTAFLDLNRSFFLHRLRVLNVSFVKQVPVRQDDATWAERWMLSWTPEAEIELVEAALKGDTIKQAVSFVFKERTENSGGIDELAGVIEDAFTCGMEETISYTIKALQAMAVDVAAVRELAGAVSRLSFIVQYNSLRRIDTKPLLPVMEQLFYRACLMLPGECVCDDAAGKTMADAIGQLNRAAAEHEFLDSEAWCAALSEIAERDDLNSRLSGCAAAILLERGLMSEDELKRQIKRRLSKGIPAELGAGWFEGLSLKNRYALIARVSVWQSLDEYLDTLDDEQFKRALVFLRRAFSDFTSREKDEIAENLGEVWGLNSRQVSETVNSQLQADEKELVDSLGDFDFDL